MPELPEIETLVIDLRKRLAGQTIEGVFVTNDEILRSPRPQFDHLLPGRKVLSVGRRGKFIRIELSGGLLLWFHLGMTGQLLLEKPKKLPRPHTHFRLAFSKFLQQLLFRDPRRFGGVTLTNSGEEDLPSGVRHLGPEPEEWKKEEFVRFFKTRRARIKSLLLNQEVLAGLGNIYADESLHRAGIHPLRRSEEISRRSLSRLHEAIREVLKEAIRWGGSSIDDYLHLDGKPGKFQNFHRVYGRSGEKCRICGSAICKLKVSGRSSSFCPRCQT